MQSLAQTVHEDNIFAGMQTSADAVYIIKGHEVGHSNLKIVSNIVTYESTYKEYLAVVLPDIGDNLAYQDGLHFCKEVYPNRNQK